MHFRQRPLMWKHFSLIVPQFSLESGSPGIHMPLRCSPLATIQHNLGNPFSFDCLMISHEKEIRLPKWLTSSDISAKCSTKAQCVPYSEKVLVRRMANISHCVLRKSMFILGVKQRQTENSLKREKTALALVLQQRHLDTCCERVLPS